MKYFDEKAIRDLKYQASTNPLLYTRSNDWVYDLLNLDIEEDKSKKLKTGPEMVSIYDLHNVKEIYGEYKDIPVELASEESFWSYLTHTSYWNYMIRRWPYKENNSNNSSNIIFNRFFFGNDQPKYRNGISRLWWYGFMTYNQELEDPYYYTEIALRDQERASLLLESVNLSRNKVALMAALDVLDEIDKLKSNGLIEDIFNQRNTLLRPLIKYINEIGAITIWDIFTQKEAREKMNVFIAELKEDGIINFKKEMIF